MTWMHIVRIVAFAIWVLALAYVVLWAYAVDGNARIGWARRFISDRGALIAGIIVIVSLAAMWAAMPICLCG